MAIPASQIVSIIPRVVQAAGTDLVLNGLFLSTSSLIPTGSVLSFATPEAVGEFFGVASDEYKAAAVYFRGYDNAFQRPRQVHFGSRVNAAAAAWLRGAKYNGTLDDLKAITAGTLTLTIDGTACAATGISLASATSYSDVATAIQTKLAAIVSSTTVEYSSQTGAFQINSPTTGASSTITVCADSALATLLGLTADAGAIVSPGSDALEVDANMVSIRKSTENWATFTHLYAATDTEILDLAGWAAEQGVEYLYVCWSTAANLKNQNETASIAYKLNQANAGATTLIFGDARYAAFIMGEAASIDWDRTQGMINFAFKAQSGLVPTIDNATEAQTLLDKNCNLYGTYATRNDEFVWLYNGNMFGDYMWLDPFVGAIWFNNALQVAIMNGLKNTPRVPYNEDGYTSIRAWCQDPINRAKKNGVIDPGVNLSEQQKAELIREAGLDITSNLQTDGYYLRIADPGAAARQIRDTPVCDLWYSYGGSVNRVRLASTLFV